MVLVMGLFYSGKYKQGGNIIADVEIFDKWYLKCSMFK
jgi:hypothetical protein